MASSRPSANKRLRERARQEYQAEKAQKKAERKAQSADKPATASGAPVIQYDEDGQPLALDFHDF
jgi:hypothetical protein